MARIEFDLTPFLPEKAQARARFRDLMETCQLDIAAYPRHLRADALEAISGLAAMDPNGPLPPDAPVSTELIGTGDGLDLPDSAPTVLGTTGFARSGKDELGDYLRRTYADVTGFAYSDLILAETNDWIGPHGYHVDQLNKVTPVLRRVCQAVGSGRKAEGVGHWMRPIGERVEQLRGSYRLVTISGLRTELDPKTGVVSRAEIDFLHSLGGEVWNVDRPGAELPEQVHHNEAGLRLLGPDDFDAWVVNGVEGRLDAYHENIEAVLRSRPQPHVPADYAHAARLGVRCPRTPAD